MGGLSSLNKERKRATKKVTKRLGRELEMAGRSLAEDFESIGQEAGRVGRRAGAEVGRKASDVIAVGTLGMVDPKAASRAQKAQKREQKRQKKIQVEQERLASLEGAQLRSEIALRSGVAKRGRTRGGLLATGEAGSLLV